MTDKQWFVLGIFTISMTSVILCTHGAKERHPLVHPVAEESRAVPVLEAARDGDTVGELNLSPLRQPIQEEIDEWRGYAEKLEKQLPQARASRLMKLTIADVQARLDQSNIVSNDAQLSTALDSMKPDDLCKVWNMERNFYIDLAAIRDKAPKDDPTLQQAYHDNVVAPFIRGQVDTICSRFYDLSVPVDRIESFRARMLEDT